MILERIPKYVIGTAIDGAMTAHCPYCRWIGLFPTADQALAAGIAHAKACEQA